MKLIPTAPIYLCMVPNNGMGRIFIRYFRRFLNRTNWTIRLRGRHSNKALLLEKGLMNRTYTMDVPIKHAERIAVYVKPKWRGL